MIDWLLYLVVLVLAGITAMIVALRRLLRVGKRRRCSATDEMIYGDGATLPDEFKGLQ